MSAIFPCLCSVPRPAKEGCARCGGERLEPVVVWGEEAPRSDRPPPRTEVPRYAEQAALDLYTRVAGRPTPKPRGRFHTRNLAVGAALLAIAAIVCHFEWDVALLRTITLALGGAGLIALLKGLLGHGPSG